MPKYSIPLSVPRISGNEWKYVKECLDTEWVSSAGKFVNEFEKKIAEYTGSKYAISCVNGTSALQVSLGLAGVLPGDEVIVPTLTFIAPVNAVTYNGASPIFMDAVVSPVDQLYVLNVEAEYRFCISVESKARLYIAMSSIFPRKPEFPNSFPIIEITPMLLIGASTLL